jgi:hypothetical protein
MFLFTLAAFIRAHPILGALLLTAGFGLVTLAFALAWIVERTKRR